jgi:mono/diheme cytochrome c family protein
LFRPKNVAGNANRANQQSQELKKSGNFVEHELFRGAEDRWIVYELIKILDIDGKRTKNDYWKRYSQWRFGFRLGDQGRRRLGRRISSFSGRQVEVVGSRILKTARILAGAAGLFIVLVCLSGCGSEFPPYPADLKYPERTEPIIKATLTTVPPKFEKPGELYTILWGLDEDDRKKNVLYPKQRSDNERKQIDELEAKLQSLFGTPSQPMVGGVDDDFRQALRLEDDTLKYGSRLYRIHCLHCHGVAGNGRGPTAPFVNPHPRDYRLGKFKFTSTDSKKLGNERKPRRNDLLRTLRQGIEGTSMPSFGLLREEELEALVSYVIHLSIRGQIEVVVMKDILMDDPDLSEPGGISKRIDENMDVSNENSIPGSWKAAEANLITPENPFPSKEERKASVQRGFQRFRDTSGQGCIKCHTDYGRQSLLFYDDWGTIGRPADLTTGVYRGGRRPIDLYWRIHSGINGSNMPGSPNLSSKDIWDIVNFLQVLPYPAMREEYGVQID